eukprot:PhF_6_TR26366/c2_g1_i3/m.38000
MKLSPRAELGLYMCLNLITFFDRGIMSGVLNVLKTDQQITGSKTAVLTDTQCGLTVSAFILGLMVSVPLFGSLGAHLNKHIAVAIGAAIWIVSLLGSVGAYGYPLFVLARAVAGVGEAAYIANIPVLVDDMVPPAARSLWMSLYFAMMPVGQALGIAIGGSVGRYQLGGGFIGWRMLLLVLAGCGVPFCVILTLVGRREMREKKEMLERAALLPTTATSSKALEEVASPTNAESQVLGNEELLSSPIPIKEQLKSLAKNTVYVFYTLGYSMYNFSILAYGTWIVTFLENGRMEMGSTGASILIGGQVIVGSLFAALIGSRLVDGRVDPTQNPNLFIENCLILLITYSLFASVLTIPCMMMTNVIAYIIFQMFQNGFVMMSVPCLTPGILTCVKRHERQLSISVTIFVMHLFGDLLSPSVMGAISDLYSAGCDGINTESRCSNDSSGLCKWIVGGEGTSPYCTNVD